MGDGMQYHAFDAAYIDNLRSGDQSTQEHFVGYFTGLLHLKLRSRLPSRDAIQDVSQETFARVLATLRQKGSLRQPEDLGAFVNAVCNNVLFERYRRNVRANVQEQADNEPEDSGVSEHENVSLVARGINLKIREILLNLPARDRSILKAIFLDERDRDDVAKEFDVDREYLRVLLIRAKQDFRTGMLTRPSSDMQG